MQNLRLLQLAFSDAIFDLRPNGKAIYKQIADNGLSAQRRLQVYRNNVYGSYTAALSSIFEVTQQLVGKEFFKYLAHEYIPDHKSKSGNIHQFGINFADFLKTHPSLSELAYLSDVAKLEWARHEVFHAPFAAINNIETLSSISENDVDAMVFVTHPALRLISSHYPILKIWNFHQQELNECSELNLEQAGESVLVFRPQLEIELTTEQHANIVLISQLMRQQPFNHVCNNFSKQHPEIEIGRMLQKLIQRGIVTGFTLAPDNTPNITN